MVYESTIVFVPIGAILILLLEGAWVVAPLQRRVLTLSWQWGVVAIGGVAWAVLFAFPLTWYQLDAETLKSEIADVETTMDSLVSYYNTYCGCIGVDASKLEESAIASLVEYVDDGLSKMLPAILGITIGAETVIVMLLAVSIKVPSRAHILRMLTFSFVWILFSTALVGAIVMTDTFRYIRDTLDNSDNDMLQMLTGHRSCTDPSRWSSITIPDPTCVRSYAVDPPAGCSYPESVITQYFLSDPTPSVDRVCVNTSRPFNDSACSACTSGCSESPSPGAACYLACYAGPEDGRTTLLTEVCALQAAVVRVLDHSDAHLTVRTELFAYGVLLGTFALIIAVEYADPRRSRLLSYDTAHDPKRYTPPGSRNIFING